MANLTEKTRPIGAQKSMASFCRPACFFLLSLYVAWRLIPSGFPSRPPTLSISGLHASAWRFFLFSLGNDYCPWKTVLKAFAPTIRVPGSGR